jgi:hypothetical protein
VQIGSAATLISTYTYAGKNISVFTLNAWNAAPIGATNVSLNQTFAGTWTVPGGVTSVGVLVVGGGGGGDGFSGGGGAGGMYSTASYGVKSGAGMTVTVGTGGAGLNYDLGANLLGNSGGLSQFGTQLIAYGGNSGADYNTPFGGDQGGYSTDGGTTTVPGMAFVGRTAYGGGAPFWGWFSGSGAGAAGANGDSAAGGIGLQSDITGVNTYYAGGGGSLVNTVGGAGGGGDGSDVFGGIAYNGVDNFGGGAGGSWGGLPGPNGGSGIVVLSYAPIPESTSGLLALTGAVGLALMRRRTRA